jgi:TetR/AcrR family transcriptional regulator, cholesterol catabolism regulator
MARKRSLNEGPVLRGRILDEATSLFAERGFAATSIRDIGYAVGISSGTMYHHFANKQAVLFAIIADFMREFLPATLSALCDDGRTAREQVADVVGVHIRLSDDRRPKLSVGNPTRYVLDARQVTEVLGQQREYRDALRAVIARGVRDGEFRVADDELASVAILDMLNGAREWYSPHGRLSLDDLAQRYTGLVMQMLDASRSDGPHGY